MDGCNGTGYCSHIDGFTADVTRELAKMYNFTWNFTKFPVNNWGATPISGSMSDVNATFDGIFGTSLFFANQITFLFVLNFFCDL